MSDLPKELLQHIFTFLGPKDFVRTSLLSKTWRNFWVSTPSYHGMSFEVNFGCLDQYSKQRSIAFLNRFLRRRRNASSTVLQCLCIQIECISYYQSLGLSNLFAIARRMNVRELYICLPNCPKVLVREAESVGRVILNSLILSAPNLKTLELENVVFPSSPKTGDDLVISCPDLETLVLKNCLFKGHGVLRLCTSELKKLEVENGCELEFNTPKLSSFLYKRNGECLLEYTFGKLDVLRNASSRFDRDIVSTKLKGSRCKLPLEEASHANVSAKGEFQALERLASSLGRLINSYGSLVRSLELEALDNFRGLTMLASLLSSFPSIEVLILNLIHDQNSYTGHEVKLALPPPCTLDNLKYVAVQGLEGFNCEHEFFAYLSNSGVNLEQIVMMEYVWAYAFKRETLEEFKNKLFQQYFRKARISIQVL